MNKVDILAERVDSTYRIPISLGNSDFGIKLDTGAKYTVISAKAIKDTLATEDLESITAYCEERSTHKEEFLSASGHKFYGYQVVAHNVELGNSIIPEFRYYLVVENKRDIALLGFDFIDHFNSSHAAHGNIVITEFDTDSYGKSQDAMESDEVIAYIDSL